jgi:nucleotide-binding universal stress UspA family protein
MDTKLYTIAIEPYSRAIILESMLKTEEISCVLMNVNTIRPDASSGVKILVTEEYLEKAMKIANQMKLDLKKPDEKGNKPLKILIPVDFSDYARNAVHYALGIANNYPGSEICLLHIYYTPEIGTIPYSESYIFADPVSEKITEIKEIATAQMKVLQEEIQKEIETRKLINIKLETLLIPGTPSDTILAYSEDYVPDLVVVGARGAGLRSEFMGGSSVRVVMKSKFPVMVIPEDSVFNYGKKEYNVLYATNYDESDFIAIARLNEILAAFRIRIYCVHVGSGEMDKWAQMKMEGLKKYFANSYPKVKIHCSMIQNDDVLEGLEIYLKKHPVDILSLTTHRRNLLTSLIHPSLTRKIIFQSDLPMLVFHTDINV